MLPRGNCQIASEQTHSNDSFLISSVVQAQADLVSDLERSAVSSADGERDGDACRATCSWYRLDLRKRSAPSLG